MALFSYLKEKLIGTKPTLDPALVKRLEERGEFQKLAELKKAAGITPSPFLEFPLIKQPTERLPIPVKKQILYAQREEAEREAAKAATAKQILPTLKEIFIPKPKLPIIDELLAGREKPEPNTADLYIGKPENLAALFKGMPEGFKQVVSRSAGVVLRNYPLFQRLLPSPFASVDVQKLLGEKKKEELAEQVEEWGVRPVFAEEETPTTKLYREAGLITGEMVPQAITASMAGKLISSAVLKYGNFIPTLKKYVPFTGEVGGWVATGQIIHQPEEENRATRALEDIGAIVGFKMGNYLLGRAVKPLKELFRTSESQEIAEKIVRGERVTLPEAEYAVKNLKIGLGIEEVRPEVKPIPKELQPLAQEARIGEVEIPKYLESFNRENPDLFIDVVKKTMNFKSAEEFKKAMGEGIEISDSALHGRIQDLRSDLDKVRISGNVDVIQRATKELEDAVLAIDLTIRDTPFRLRVTDTGKVEIIGFDAKDIPRGFYEPTILGVKISAIQKRKIPEMIKELERKGKMGSKQKFGREMDETIAKEQIAILREIESGKSLLADFYNQAVKGIKEVKPVVDLQKAWGGKAEKIEELGKAMPEEYKEGMKQIAEGIRKKELTEEQKTAMLRPLRGEGQKELELKEPGMGETDLLKQIEKVKVKEELPKRVGFLSAEEQSDLARLKQRYNEDIFTDNPITEPEIVRMKQLEEKEMRNQTAKINTAEEVELNKMLIEEKDYQEKTMAQVDKEMKATGGYDYADSEMQAGYDNFKDLLKNPKMRSPDVKEKVETGDIERLKKIVVDEKKIMKINEFDQMFYSQALSEDEIMELFKIRLMKEDPGLLVGRKVALGIVPTAKKLEIPSLKVKPALAEKLKVKRTKEYLIQLKKDLVDAIIQRGKFEALMNKVKILPKGRRPIQMIAPGEDIGDILKIGKGGGQRRVYREDLEGLKGIQELPAYRSGWIGRTFQAIGRGFEPAIFTFEKIGKSAKEILYYPLREAKKEYKLAFNKFLDEFGKRTEGMGNKESERIMIYALSQEPEYNVIQKAGKKILIYEGKEIPIPDLTPKETEFYLWGRRLYESLFQEINFVRRANGQESIGYRKNYWTHLQELGLLDQLGFDISRAPVNLIEGWIKMLAPAFRFGKHRLGMAARFDSFKALSAYANLALKHRFVGRETGRLRMLVDQVIPDINLETGEVNVFKMSEKSPNSYKFLTQWIDAQLSNGRISFPSHKEAELILDGVSRASNILAHNISTANLAGNLSSILVQPTAIANTVVKLGYKQTFKGLLEYTAKGSTEAMNESDHLLSRIFDVYFSKAKLPELEVRGLIELKTKLGRILISPLQYLDLKTATVTYYAARDFAKNTLKMGTKEAKRFADDTVIETQASADLMDISPIQRTKLGKAFTLFQTYVINNFRFLTEQFGHAKSPQELALRLFRYITIATVFNTIMKDGLGLNPPFPEIYDAAKEGYEREGLKGAGIEITKEMAEQVPVWGGMVRYGGSPLGAVATEIGKTYRNLQLFKPGKEHIARFSFDVATLFGMPATKQVEKSTRSLIDDLKVRGGDANIFGNPRREAIIKWEDLSWHSKLKTVLHSVYNTKEAEVLISAMNKYENLTRDWRKKAESLKDEYVKATQKNHPTDKVIDKIFEFNQKVENGLLNADKEGYLINVATGRELQKLIQSFQISDIKLNNWLKKE